MIKARKKYDVKYPLLYAPDKHPDATAFNSAQRAHQNTLESISLVNVSMLVNAILFPKLSAALGAIWCVGRVIYIHGYATGGPKGRTLGGGARALPNARRILCAARPRPCAPDASVGAAQPSRTWATSRSSCSPSTPQ